MPSCRTHTSSTGEGMPLTLPPSYEGRAPFLVRFSDSFGIERFHLTAQCMVQVGRDGSCLVCSALSKARAAVEDLVDQNQASGKPYNGRLTSQKVSNTTDLASRTSKSSAAPQGNDASAKDTSKSTRQLREKAGTLPSLNGNGSAEQNSTGATFGGENSAQQSSATLQQQSDAVASNEDTLLQERQHSSSAASNSTGPLEVEPASENVSPKPRLCIIWHTHIPALFAPTSLYMAQWLAQRRTYLTRFGV